MTKSKGINRPKKLYWSEAEDQFLRSCVNRMTWASAAFITGLRPHQVYKRVAFLKLKHSDEFLKSVLRKRAQFNSGFKQHQYTKGHVPANKGKKGLVVSTPAMKATQFKPGEAPVNTLYDGAITVRHDHKNRGGKPYKWIRIAKANWKMLHVKIWEQANGPVPKGMVVRFMDGDTMNCTLENLELITRAEHLRRNSIHRYPEQVRNLIRTQKKLERKIKNYGKK